MECVVRWTSKLAGGWLAALGLLGASAPAVVGQGGATSVAPAAEAAEDGSRLGVAVEVFFTDEPLTRDMRIYAFSVEGEAELGAGFWVRGALGPTVTQGRRGRRFGTLDPDGNRIYSGGREANSTGLGSTGFLRWRSPRVGPVAPFIEGGSGLLVTTEPFPPDGTPWNFTYRVGVGLDLGLSRHLSLAIAFRHMHVSNAKGHVRENPGYNGNGFMVAVGW